MGRYLLVALLAAGAGVRAAAAQSVASPDIGGIYVIGQKYVLPANIWKNGNGLLKPAARNPGVDGVLIDLTWSDIARGYRKYDWSLLDFMARVAVDNHKKFEIAIIAGSSTPAWVFAAAPNGFGAQSATFDYIQSTKPGAVCEPQTIAPPWDKNYLRAFADLLRRLRAHLLKKNYYDDLAMLRITGINTLTDELRLPAQTPETTGNYTVANKCTVDNLQLWQSLGYTPAKVSQAWRYILRSYRKFFPDKTFNVALITAGGFPAFTADGAPVASPLQEAESLGNAMTTRLVKEAGRILAGQFALQSNGLVDHSSDPATIKDALKARAVLGWQTNEWGDLAGGAACGGTRSKPVTCTASEFAAMLRSGIYPEGATDAKPLQARYLELFPPNIIAFPRIVVNAHDLLLAQ